MEIKNIIKKIENTRLDTYKPILLVLEAEKK